MFWRKILRALDWTWRAGTVLLAGFLVACFYKVIDTPDPSMWARSNLLWFAEVGSYIYGLLLFVCLVGSLTDEG